VRGDQRGREAGQYDPLAVFILVTAPPVTDQRSEVGDDDPPSIVAARVEPTACAPLPPAMVDDDPAVTLTTFG
jgi:hypothetical protein